MNGDENILKSQAQPLSKQNTVFDDPLRP
jgi:hypothetical protein